MTGKLFLVFRFKADVLDENALIPVDIFSADGKFLGTAQIKQYPLWLSDSTAYFQESEDDELLLVNYKYSIK